MRNVRVVIWGFGAMGSGMARLILQKKGIEITGVCDHNASRAGKDMYAYLGIDPEGRPPLIMLADPALVITERCCDVLILATDSFTKSAFERIRFCLEKKINAISIAEELSYPQAQNPEMAAELDRIAIENGVTLLGTGINPGFILDTLILALTGTCERVDSIYARRVNDLSPFGRAVMREQGVGITPDEYQKRMSEGSLAGHIGFPESIRMITDGIGLKLDKVEQSKDPIISTTHRETPYVTVEPGNLAGLRQRGFGYVDGKVFVEMDHPQQVLPHLEGVKTGDTIEIKGVPDIHIQTSPEIPGGIGTISMAVNMIPHVINAEPGLKTMLDLPVPRALMGDVRGLLRKPLVD